MKKLLTLILALFAVASLVAQNAPEGWRERIDRSTSATDPDAEGDVRIVTTDTGYHIETPSAAVFWHPDNTVSGNYTLKGQFTLNEPSGHTNYYGLIFGGSALEGADQHYTYFMVAQNGAWLIKTRQGASATSTYADLEGTDRSGAVTSNVVRTPGADGRSVNNLEVRVTNDGIAYVVNDTVVHSAARDSVVTDGIWGVRSNHLLNINVDALAVEQ